MSSQDPRLVSVLLFMPSNDEKEKPLILTAKAAGFKESVSMGTSSKSVTAPRTGPPLHLVLIYSYLCNNATWRLSSGSRSDLLEASHWLIRKMVRNGLSIARSSTLNPLKSVKAWCLQTSNKNGCIVKTEGKTTPKGESSG
ncbi:uncharacterized [Tachysurus ichikawai]